MKTIDTLVSDILDILENGLDEIQEDKLVEFEKQFSGSLNRQLVQKYQGGTLRMSNIGSPCQRKLWYQVNDYDNPLKEKLTGDTKIKFLYGDLTEEMVLFLADLAGHTVEARQSEVELNGVKGHIDAIIDGWLVDVKSASSYSFKKFKEGRLLDDDPFGYYTQIMSYLYCLQEDERLVEKDKAAFLVFDKQLGHLCLDKHEKPVWFDTFPLSYDRRKETVNSKEVPERSFDPEPEGKSGNMKLGTFCSYCDFKRVCYPELRTFIYSRGPVFLTEVVKEPDVFEKVD